MLDNMADVITVMDMNLRFTYVSPSIMRMRGYTAEEAMAQTFEQVMTPESLQISAKVFEEEMKLEASGTADPDRIRIVEVEQYRKDGSIVLMENHLSFMRDEAKKPVGIISVSHDITERKRAEVNLKESKELIEAVVENVPLMIFLKEAVDLRFVIFNRAGEELLGYDRKVLLGKNNLDLFPPEQAAHFMAKDREVLDGESGILDIPEEPILTAKKGQRLLHTRKVCIRGADGATKYLLGISEDITERKRAERDLQEARDQLLQSEKLSALGQLSAGVAHEILNPVNIISMELQLLQAMEGLPSEVLEELKICMLQIDRIVYIANDLKLFARKHEKKMGMANINSIIDHVLTLHKSQLMIDGIETGVQYQSDLPEVAMDQEKMEQVILNLISNARVAMAGKEKKVLRIITERETVSGDRDQLKITIADTGTGIKSEHMSKIFDPFFTTKERGKGTGLGLSISYGIVHDHGGMIWAANNEWGGASFYVRLPVKTDAEKNHC